MFKNYAMITIDNHKLLERITEHSNEMSAQSTIRNTVLTVEEVFEAISEGLSFNDMKEKYPFLEPSDVRACLLYATKFYETHVLK
jgi:uncharacterized protein (DUF433 family)